jgi:hypothetical protein
VIVCFGQLLEDYKGIPHFLGYFKPRLSLWINFDQNDPLQSLDGILEKQKTDNKGL